MHFDAQGGIASNIKVHTVSTIPPAVQVAIMRIMLC